MLYEVTGEGDTKGKEIRVREEEKQEDNLGEVACHSDDWQGPKGCAVNKTSCLTLYLRIGLLSDISKKANEKVPGPHYSTKMPSNRWTEIHW